jgi:hypothetical protein
MQVQTRGNPSVLVQKKINDIQSKTSKKTKEKNRGNRRPGHMVEGSISNVKKNVSEKRTDKK